MGTICKAEIQTSKRIGKIDKQQKDIGLFRQYKLVKENFYSQVPTSYRSDLTFEIYTITYTIV